MAGIMARVLVMARKLGGIMARGIVRPNINFIGLLKTDLFRLGGKSGGSFIFISPMRAQGLP